MGRTEIRIERIPIEVVKKKLREKDGLPPTEVNCTTAVENRRRPGRRRRATNHVGGNAVNEDMKMRLRTLCEEAGAEQDPERLMQLVREIDRLLAGEREAAEKGNGKASRLEQAG